MKNRKLETKIKFQIQIPKPKPKCLLPWLFDWNSKSIETDIRKIVISWIKFQFKMKDSTLSLNWRIERKRMKTLPGLILRHFLLFWQPTMGIMIRNHETWLRPGSWGRLCNKSYPVPPTAGPVSRLGKFCPARTLTRWPRTSIPSGENHPPRPASQAAINDHAIIPIHSTHYEAQAPPSHEVDSFTYDSTHVQDEGKPPKGNTGLGTLFVEKPSEVAAQSKAPELKRHLSWNRGVPMATRRVQILLAVFLCSARFAHAACHCFNSGASLLFQKFFSQKIGKHQF